MDAQGFGSGERAFRQTYAIRLLLALLILGPVFAAWAMTGEPKPAAHPVLLWISLAVFIVYGFLWIAIGKTVLTISEQGVRRDSVFSTEEMPWSQISETRYVVKPIRASAHFGLIGALVSTLGKSSAVNLTLTLISSDGQRIRITSNFQRAKEAAGVILGRILPPMVSAARSKLQRGETLSFGQLGLSATSVKWKQQAPIPLAQLSSAEIVGTDLRLKRPGKWMSAVRVRSDKIPNVLVFLELVESLAPQLKRDEVGPLAGVRI
jgi:Family of unknown function (DUF6585)